MVCCSEGYEGTDNPQAIHIQVTREHRLPSPTPSGCALGFLTRPLLTVPAGLEPGELRSVFQAVLKGSVPHQVFTPVLTQLTSSQCLGLMASARHLAFPAPYIYEDSFPCPYLQAL